MGILDAPALSPSIYSTLSRDSATGASDRARSSARALARFDESAQITELWATVSAWSSTVPLQQVSGGYTYKSSDSTAGMLRPFTVADDQTARIIGNIRLLAAGGGTAFLFVGIHESGALNINKMLGIGVDPSTNQVKFWNKGSVEALSGSSALPAGDYEVSVSVGLTTVGFTLTNATRTVEYRRTVLRLATVGNVMVWNTDTRLTAGSGVGSIGAKITHTTIKPRAGVEGVAPTSLLGASGSGVGLNTQRIVAPRDYDSRVPSPVVIYFHGLGGNVDAPYTGSASNFEKACVNAGYIFAASDGYSDSSFGMQAAIDEYVRVYRNVRDTHNIGRVFLMGESMGGLVSLNLLGQRAIPNVAGYVGIYPLTSLEAAYATSSGWATQIRTNYGIAANGSDYDAKTAGYSPIKRPASDYQGVPMRFYASPGDAVVSKAANTDAFAARVAGVTPEATVVATTGDHGDVSNFTTAMQNDMLAFLARNGGL